MLRVVLDTNVLVSAAIGSLQGASAVLLAAAQSREITILACTRLIDELSDTLGRPHLRKRISQDEADAYVDGVTLLAEWVDDRPAEQIPPICAGSEDDFLVALYQDGDAVMLISGDRAVQQITYPNVYVYTPVEAVKVLARRREQGANYLPGEAEDFRLHVEAEGHRPLVTLYAHLHRLLMLGSPEELETKLPALVVPDALAGFAPKWTQCVNFSPTVPCIRGLPTLRPISHTCDCPPTRESSFVTPRTWCFPNRRFS